MTAKKTLTKQPSARKVDTYKRDLAELLSGREYVLIGQRTCAADGNSALGFVYPQRGWAECADWNARAECGGGLHFCAVGAVGGVVVRDGGSTIKASGQDLRWQVVLALASDSVRIDGEKHKARRVFVLDLDGTQAECGAWLHSHGIVGHYMTATAGDRGTATAGYGGTATAGDRGTIKTGDGGVAITTWIDDSGNKQVKAWTVGKGRDLKANTAYHVVAGVATEITK